jgi:thiamine biosynthesis lipoprotein
VRDAVGEPVLRGNGPPDKFAQLLDMGFERPRTGPLVTDVVRVGPRASRVTATRPAMGTLVSLIGLGPSPAQVEAAIGSALAEMDRLIALFSRYDAQSAVSVLNDAGRLEGPPPEMAALVREALRYHAVTRGAFDVSVAPLVNLFRRRLGGAAPTPPSEAELRDALALVGARHVSADRRRIRFARSGMGLTLDGIAKGRIVDAMARVLERSGVRDFLIEAGGDIRTSGTKEGGQPWTIAVRDPLGAAPFSDAIRLSGAAVATSGSYEIHFGGDRLFHHIVDATSGRSPTHSVSVTIIAPTATAADALATGVFVMGPVAGVRLIESLSGCACLIIDGEGRHTRSRGWPGATPQEGANLS